MGLEDWCPVLPDDGAEDGGVEPFGRITELNREEQPQRCLDGAQLAELSLRSQELAAFVLLKLELRGARLRIPACEIARDRVRSAARPLYDHDRRSGLNRLKDGGERAWAALYDEQHARHRVPLLQEKHHLVAQSDLIAPPDEGGNQEAVRGHQEAIKRPSRGHQEAIRGISSPHPSASEGVARSSPPSTRTKCVWRGSRCAP